MNSYLALYSFHIQDGKRLLGDCLAHAFGEAATSRRKKEKSLLASASSNPSRSYWCWLGVCRRSLPPIVGQFKWYWNSASWPPWWLPPWSRKRSEEYAYNRKWLFKVRSWGISKAQKRRPFLIMSSPRSFCEEVMLCCGVILAKWFCIKLIYQSLLC